MGMIRVSDEIEKQLKEMADGRSMTATVEMLIKATENTAEELFGNGGGALVEATAGIVTKHFDEKFDELRSELLAAINDTAVDRLARVQKKKDPISIDWPDVQYIMFELLEEDAPEWTCKEASKGAHESSELEALTWLADDDFIYTTNGTRTNWLTITPRIKSYLGEHYDI